jgi:hypothetical protein
MSAQLPLINRLLEMVSTHLVSSVPVAVQVPQLQLLVASALPIRSRDRKIGRFLGRPLTGKCFSKLIGKVRRSLQWKKLVAQLR